MEQPNLFSFATSELSQDAFICWFLSWAKEENKDKDQSLHNCAREFISAIFDKHKPSKKIPSEITSIEIKKQDKKIDVLCIVNKEFPIIIEDKTNTVNHSNQLERYLEEIKGRKYDHDKILPIYYKTEDQSSYSKVLENNYMPFRRDEMISILEKYNGTNHILIDYRNYLSNISAQVKGYANTPVTKWTWRNWIGFYLCLQQELYEYKGKDEDKDNDKEDNRAHWRYVSNPRGGFLGFWWHWQRDDECRQYLQLEKETLCFRICMNGVADNTNKQKFRSKWHRAIKNSANTDKFKELTVIKPARFGNGKTMTVCINEGDYRVTKNNGILDMGKTVKTT